MTQGQPGWGDRRPGWYLDPAGGRQQRFWDGSQWTEQVKPVARRRKHTTLLVIGVIAAFVAFLFGLDWGLTAVDHYRLDRRLNAIKLPADLQLVSQEHRGFMCLDVCSTLWRRYSSPRSRAETHQVFTAELQRLGYQCLKGCGPVEEFRSSWRRPGKPGTRPRIDVDVDDTAVLPSWDVKRYGTARPKDASRPVHVDIRLEA